ncbi:MAG: amidohydrolase family protein [Betaproteobacteria bacterium]
MTVFDEPRIDCHVHVFDPVHFPYAADTFYRPAGQETGSAEQLMSVLDAYGTRYALIVGPNSGYGLDNRCLLDAIARSDGRCKGIAHVANDIGLAELEALKAEGIVGVAWNVTHYGAAYYEDASPLLERLRALGMFVSLQVERDLLVPFAPMLVRSGVRLLIDHAGRPSVTEGLDQPGFRALLELAATRRVFVKLSGMMKYSRQVFPFADTRPYFDALLDAYTPDACMWASDWPNIRAASRVDYGVLLKHIEQMLPDPAHRHRVLWETPKALLGFGE